MPTAAVNLRNTPNMVEKTIWKDKSSKNFDDKYLDLITTNNPEEPIEPDSYYVPEQETSFAGEQNDIGYNTDSGNNIYGAKPIYVGEPVEEKVPGRGRTGSLDSNEGDSEDWYSFSACEGQTIQASVSGSGASAELYDYEANPISSGFTADQTGIYFVQISTSGGSVDYTISVSLSGQNDAGQGTDAGNSIGQAMDIEPGSYSGYLSVNDQEDWYKFDVSSGQGIFVDLSPVVKSDFDVYLYNPSGELVHKEMYYGEDHLEYPADASGTWKIKLDIFPGWDENKWPDNYFLYGSGAYEFSLSVGGSAESPPGPIPQPEVTPVAQTFEIANDPNSNEDEYSFLAAVPNAVYTQGGTQYVSPIVYTGDNTKTNWFGTADDTTQYLIDDWNTYLSRHGYLPEVYKVDSNPVKAAADLATKRFTKSDNAVLTVDGSKYKDDWTTLIDEDSTLDLNTKKTTLTPDDGRFSDFSGHQAVQMWMGKEWGAMTIYAYGPDCPAVGVITPRYELGTSEDWPHPYDTPGDNTNIYFPIAIPGLYWPYVDSPSGFNQFEITRYSCDRYKVPVSDTDTSLKVTVSTEGSSYLEVFLVDPQGNVRRPSVPSWNGGTIKPIHQWNGDHHNGFEDYKRWQPDYSSEHTVEINYPMEGNWRVVVVPHYPYGNEKSSDSIPYHIKAQLREHNEKRVNAGLSAANAAVLASQMNVPMLYVNENSIPKETKMALDKLGVKESIFVNLNRVSSAKPDNVAKEITVMDDMIRITKSKTNKMKASSQSDNTIVITSFGTENGYFAPAGLIAAYHGSNVLNMGEIPEAYNYLDKASTWRGYAGGWYHGCRSQGYLAKMDEPIDILNIIRGLLNGNFPPLGLDQQLRWFGKVHDGIRNWINDQGLDSSGKEAFIFVADRDNDIRHPICRVMSGLESYAGQIPFSVPSMDAALISRDILYPALIYANPGRDVTTTQMMNFPDGWQWTTNDGQSHTVYSTRLIKNTFSSHGRFYEGHVTWEGWLERINNGASVSYYSGHGTGGSGVSAQYTNVAESFPDAELRHESLHDFDWWDAWRGYMYDDKQTKTARWGGFTWYNAAEPNLYDIIHFKWVDQLLENLHSEFELWMSCTTGEHFGPDIYLEHGSALWYGNAGTGLCPQEDLLDDTWIRDMMVYGKSVGDAFSDYAWLHQRDFTTKDPVSMYGTSSMQVTNVQVIFGDPTMTCYSPDWTEPTPVNP